MSVVAAFDDIAGLLARIDPEKIAQLRPSKQMVERVEELVYRKKDGEITVEESIELENLALVAPPLQLSIFCISSLSKPDAGTFGITSLL